MQLSAIIQLDDDMYVALCPELDIASQGETIEAARVNLQEAVEGFLEVASDTEITRRLSRPPIAIVTPLRVNQPARLAA